MESKTIVALLERKAERRRRRVISRLQNILCAVGVAACVACLIYMEWPVLAAAREESAPEEVTLAAVEVPVVETPKVQPAKAETVISKLKAVAVEVNDAEDEPVSLGEFKITHYCACSKCCGKAEDDPWYGITATGTRVTEGRTIAVDPKVIPYGTEVTIRYQDGTEHTYIAEDCGGAIKGNRIDVYMESHEAANMAGVRYGEVYMDVSPR